MCKQDAGKYMVKAINEAGETQSIADFIILEATPEQIVDIVNTVSVENTEGQRVCDQISTKYCFNKLVFPKIKHS